MKAQGPMPALSKDAKPFWRSPSLLGVAGGSITFLGNYQSVFQGLHSLATVLAGLSQFSRRLWHNVFALSGDASFATRLPTYTLDLLSLWCILLAVIGILPLIPKIGTSLQIPTFKWIERRFSFSRRTAQQIGNTWIAFSILFFAIPFFPTIALIFGDLSRRPEGAIILIALGYYTLRFAAIIQRDDPQTHAMYAWNVPLALWSVSAILVGSILIGTPVFFEDKLAWATAFMFLIAGLALRSALPLVLMASLSFVLLFLGSVGAIFVVSYNDAFP